MLPVQDGIITMVAVITGMTAGPGKNAAEGALAEFRKADECEIGFSYFKYGDGTTTIRPTNLLE